MEAAKQPKDSIVFVDVDYTISPNTFPKNRDTYVSAWHGRHSISSDLFEALDNLGADKCWLTAWHGEAESTFQRGWPHLAPATDDYDYWDWKLHEAEKFLKANPHYKNVIWLDDDLPQWADKIERGGRNWLLIAPETHMGLGPNDFKKMREFLRENSADAPAKIPALHRAGEIALNIMFGKP